MLMIILLLILAGIIILCGLLLLVRPQILIRIGSVFNRVITGADTVVLTYRWLWGAIFLLIGAYLYYVGFTS